MQYDKFLGEIPAYLAGQLAREERDTFESFADSHPDFRRELDDVRSTFEWVGSEFAVAGKTDFRLSPGRRAALRRDTDANVIAFPGDRNVGRGAVHGRGWLSRGRVSGWLTVAASLVLLSIVGLRSGSEQAPIADKAMQVAVHTERALPEFSNGYEYSPAYGLDRPSVWLAPASTGDISVGYAMLEAEMELAVEESGRRTSGAWQYESLGMDGPRPFYSLSAVRGLGAI